MSSPDNTERRFADWMTRVDIYLEETLGVTSADLPDMNYWEMFDRRTSAYEMASIVYQEARDSSPLSL